MLGDCHVHMVLDGVYYKDAIARHKPVPDEAWVRQTLHRYQRDGITFVRDGGDAFGVCLLAARLAPEYGITYRTPAFPIYRKGHYGGFIGRGFDTFGEYHALVREAAGAGADFIKIMISGLMDFSQYGVITDQPLEPAEIRDMIAAAHDEGLAVMAHANGTAAVEAALLGGVDSIEHGSYLTDDCLHLLAGSDAVWVPTAVTIGNLRGGGRYPEEAVAQILEMQLSNVKTAHGYGARIALGSDAGAWHVFHSQGARAEYALLRQALGAETDAVLSRGEAFVQARFCRGGLSSQTP